MGKKRRSRRRAALPEPPRRPAKPPAEEPAKEPAPPRGRSRFRPSPRTLLIAGLAAVLAAAGAAGLARVRAGEVAVVRGAGDQPAAVWEPGWHWRLPGRGAVRRLPVEPIPLERDLEVRTAEGAAITLEVAGRFGIAPGGARSWVAAAGWEPFGDALFALAAEELGRAVHGADPAELFQPGAAGRLAAGLRGGLEGAGAAVAELTVRAPIERNPVALAVARSRVAGLARPTGRKVLLVGWDGADWLMIRPLLEAGRLPNLARLIERGAAGELRSQEPLLSPLVWTTIATGKPVVEHGIADFLVRDPASGELVPISSTSRKVHALWTILPAFGLSTDAVAWWATWPAEPTLGTLITDRVAYQLFSLADQPSPAGKVYPQSAWEWVADELVTAEQITFEEVRRFVDVERDDFERRWNELPPERRQDDRINHLRKVLATTRSYHAIALELLREQADLTMMYYEGTDTVGHLFARFLPPVMPGVGAEEVRRFGDALPKFYQYADELLGELLDAADPETTVLLVSDHGFFTGAARPAADPADFTMGAPQWHRLYGVIVGAGPGIRRGGTVEGATVFDVAPTILALLGLPIPADLPGRALPALLPAGAEPVRPVQLASYEELPRSRPEEGPRGDEAMDEERLRELVALGYISPAVLEGRGGGEGGRAAPGGAAGAPQPRAPASDGLQAVVTEAFNLGAILQRRGDLEGARRHYEIAIERMPSFGQAHGALAQLAALGGDHCRAFELLVRGFTKSRTMPSWGLTGLVDEGEKCGRLDEVEGLLEALRPTHQERSAFYAAVGLLHSRTGRPDSALEQYRRALAIDPLDQLANEDSVTILRRQGREREAREFLDRAFARARGEVTGMNYLAVIALRQGWADDAERLLRQVLASDPGNPGVMANLASALARQGKSAEALAMMQQAVERDPRNSSNLFNLGAMLERQGRVREALAAFEGAEENGLRSSRLYVAMAKMRFRLDDRTGSARELEKALAIDPGNREAREMLDALAAG